MNADCRWRIVHSEASLGWGGQERRTMAELVGFRNRRSEVWLIAPRRAELFRRAEQAGISCEPLAEARWKFPFSVLKVAAWLRCIRPHVVNTHSSRDGWLVGLAARLARVPLVIRTRHFDVLVPNRWLSRHAYATLCDHVITTSPKVAAEFRELFRLPEDRVTVISTGIDLAEFSPEGPKAELKLRASDGPLLGIIGVIRRAKGHVILLEAARRLCDASFPVRCVFVGDGPNRPAVEEKIRELNLGDRVLFTGERDDVPAALRALDVLAIPSLHEAIPQVGLQALACKTPVVASKVGGLPEIIRPDETGRLVPPGDPPALAAAIRETLEQPAVTRALAARGRALVEEQHGLEAMLDRIEAIYRRRLEREPEPAPHPVHS
jgi:glycosyltransferase involved in cell wall biosynthesis